MLYTCRHTHELVDQVFSVFSRALNRKNCPDLPSFVKTCRSAYNPPVPPDSNFESMKPMFYELRGTLAIQDWLDGAINELRNVTQAHQFVIKHAGIWDARWHNSEYQGPVDDLLIRMPGTKPRVLANRHIMFSKDSDAATQASLWEKAKKQMTTLMSRTVDFAWRPETVSFWNEELGKLSSLCALPSRAWGKWWPCQPADVVNAGVECDATLLLEPDAQGSDPHGLDPHSLVVGSTPHDPLFIGLHTGPARYFNIEGEDARAGNVVFINQKNTWDLDNEEILGEWETSFIVGVVKKRYTMPAVEAGGEGHDVVDVEYYQPWSVDQDGEAQMPLWTWSAALVEDGCEPQPSAWEDVLHLPWRPSTYLPKKLAEQRGIQGRVEEDAHGIVGVQAVELTGRRRYVAKGVSIDNIMWVARRTPAEVKKEELRFPPDTRRDLRGIPERVEFCEAQAHAMLTFDRLQNAGGLGDGATREQRDMLAAFEGAEEDSEH